MSVEAVERVADFNSACQEKEKKRSVHEYDTAVNRMKWLECGYKGFNEVAKNAQL